MASDRGYLEFILEQLAELDGVHAGDDGGVHSLLSGQGDRRDL